MQMAMCVLGLLALMLLLTAPRTGYRLGRGPVARMAHRARHSQIAQLRPSLHVLSVSRT